MNCCPVPSLQDCVVHVLSNLKVGHVHQISWRAALCMMEGERCECGAHFFLALVEARSTGVRSGKGRLVSPAFTSQGVLAISPPAFGLRAAVDDRFGDVWKSSKLNRREATPMAHLACEALLTAHMGTKATHMAYPSCEAVVMAQMGTEVARMAHAACATAAMAHMRTSRTWLSMLREGPHGDSM